MNHYSTQQKKATAINSLVLPEKFNLNETDKQKLQTSFIIEALAEKAFLRRVTDEQGAEIVCRKRNANNDCAGLVFPYTLPNKKDSFRQFRLRPDSRVLVENGNSQIQEKGAKYLSAAGAEKPRLLGKFILATKL